MNKSALRYKLLKIAQKAHLVDSRMEDSEPEFREQAKGLFKEFCVSEEFAQTNIFAGMQNLVDRKMSYIPHG